MHKLFLIIVALIIPPLAVGLAKGIGKDFLINIVLTVILFIPGVVHALWLLLK